MRVAVLSYPMLFQTGGGLRMKVSRTVDALNRRGLEARLVDTVRESLRDFDLVHVFTPYNGNYRIVEQAKSDGMPVVLSTIFTEPFSRLEGVRARLLSFLIRRFSGWKMTTSYQQSLGALIAADHLVALGTVEKRILVEAYGIPEPKISIVQNGIGDEFFSASATPFRDAYPDLGPFVLHVGLIGEQKNQLGLIRALRADDVDVVLLGHVGQTKRDYLNACIQEGRGRVRYLGELPHGPMMASAYAAANVVAIPSEYEGMPNAILEALASDRPAVLTKNHTMDLDLPPDVAREVVPDDEAAIRTSVLHFFKNPPPPGRARSIVSSMNWDSVAAQLEDIYRNAVITRADLPINA